MREGSWRKRARNVYNACLAPVVKVRGPDRPTPADIVRAAGDADLARMEELDARGADWNARWRNYRPLHALIQEDPHGPHALGKADPQRLKCLDWLLAHGADPEQVGAWPSARALIIAAFVGVPEYVDRLRSAGARIDIFVQSALGDLGAVSRQLKKDPALANATDADTLTGLQACAGSRLFRTEAAGNRRLRTIATRLLDAGADPNARARSWGKSVDAAYFAIAARHLEMLELLLTRGADAESALVAAAWQEDHAFAELTLAHGAKPDAAREGDRPILNELVRWGRFDGALWLLEQGASPNVADARGWTALHQAVSRGSARMVEALRAAGGDPSWQDQDGLSPRGLARQKGKRKLEVLLS